MKVARVFVVVLLATLCFTGFLAQESAESAESAEEATQARGGNQPGGSNPGRPNGGLGPRQLQVLEGRLRFVRRELEILSRVIGSFLPLNPEQEGVLREELLFSLELAVFGPPPTAGFPPLQANEAD